jgi:hypothetical protein
MTIYLNIRHTFMVFELKRYPPVQNEPEGMKEEQRIYTRKLPRLGV